MAPPTLVYSAAEIQKRYQKQLENPAKYLCVLRSITQHECTFKMRDTEVPEIICLPFKRVFQRCLENAIVKDKNGKKTHVEKWVNIEVTNEQTNSDMSLESRKYGKDVGDFLLAEKELQEYMSRDINE